MSYSGKSTAPFLIQGLSSSGFQDTWSDDRVSYTATDNVAELPSYYTGDWCVRISNNQGSNFYQNCMPYNGAHKSEHGLNEDWTGTTNFTGSETLVCARSSAGVIGHYKTGTTPTRDYAGCSTVCEIFV